MFFRSVVFLTGLLLFQFFRLQVPGREIDSGETLNIEHESMSEIIQRIYTTLYHGNAEKTGTTRWKILQLRSIFSIRKSYAYVTKYQ